jgi:hypothetical protein
MERQGKCGDGDGGSEPNGRGRELGDVVVVDEMIICECGDALPIREGNVMEIQEKREWELSRKRKATLIRKNGAVKVAREFSITIIKWTEDSNFLAIRASLLLDLTKFGR